MTATDASWRARAACRGTATDLFFPERGGDHRSPQTVCAACPVRAECREAGIGEHHGIWGGTTERERRGLRRARLGRSA